MLSSTCLLNARSFSRGSSGFAGRYPVEARELESPWGSALMEEGRAMEMRDDMGRERRVRRWTENNER